MCKRDRRVCEQLGDVAVEGGIGAPRQKLEARAREILGEALGEQRGAGPKPGVDDRVREFVHVD